MFVHIHVEDKEWDPQVHPKDPEGKFAKKGTGTGAAAEPKAKKPKGEGVAAAKPEVEPKAKKPLKKDLMAEAKALGLKVTTETTVPQFLAMLEEAKKTGGASKTTGAKNKPEEKKDKPKKTEAKPVLLENWEGEWTPDKVSSKQVRAIDFYCGNGYTKINKYLRNTITKVSGGVLAHIGYLDQVVDNAIFTGDIYRGVSSKTRDRLAEAGALTPGAIIEDRAFKSFSYNSVVASSWKSGKGLVIKAEGTKGCADISSISHLYFEAEVLVSRAMSMRVIAWDPKQKLLEVELFMDKDTGKPSDKKAKKPKAAKDARPDPMVELDRLMSRIPHRDKSISLVQRWKEDEDFGMIVKVPGED